MKCCWKPNLALPVLLLGLAAFGPRPANASQSFQPVVADPASEPWRWRVFPELSGLGLQSIGAGKDGTMWFGTADGAWSYDGLRWAFHGAREGLSGVETFCTDSLGNVYASTSMGISCFTGRHWTPVFVLRKKSAGAVKRLIMGRDATLWAATSWGLLRHKGPHWVLYTDKKVPGLERSLAYQPVRVELLPDEVLSKPHGTGTVSNRFDFFEAYEDHQNRLWLGTEAGEVLCLKPLSPHYPFVGVPTGPGGQWTLYTESDGLGSCPRPRFLQLQDGTVLAANSGSPSRLNRFDGVRWTSQRLQDIGAPDDCSSLLQTSDGVLWLGCNGAIAANRGGQWQVYEAPKVPIPTVQTVLFQGSDGALWVAGKDAEVLRLDYQTPRWTTYLDLNFQCETAKGAQWFLHRDGRVVVRDGDRWTSYGPEDGLIDSPTSIFAARNGDIWVAGSQEHVAATAHFDGVKWKRDIHGDFSWGIGPRCAFEAADGTIWLGAPVEPGAHGMPYKYGLKRCHDGKWFHHTFISYTPYLNGTNSPRFADPADDPVGKFLGLAESRLDKRLWVGTTNLTSYDGKKWAPLAQDLRLQMGMVETMFTSKEGELWVGSRQFGVFRYDGRKWQRFHVKEGLVANTIRGITQSADGSIWVATDRGLSRFDGHDWISDILPPAVSIPREGGTLKASASGALWVNRCPQDWNRRAWTNAPRSDLTNATFCAVCFQPGHAAPRTALILAPESVPQPGNLTLSWKGLDPWHATPDSRLQYSYRMDYGPWSRYSSEQHHSFFSLSGGNHHFEVRARDDDFNVDPQPASIDFVVLPPVWQQGWFLALVAAFTGVILIQAARLISREQHLRRTNGALAAEIEERKRIQLEVDQAHKQLLQASRQVGMAEVATNVLHSVGNVLNSVNVSADLLTQRLRDSRLDGLPKLADLLAEHSHDPNFLAQHEKGRQVPAYLKSLSAFAAQEREETLKELSSLRRNVNHIKEIVAMQQEYSRLGGFTESVKLTELIEDALRLNEGALARHRVQLVRDFRENSTVVVEKYKVLQILDNLIRNAQEACQESGKPDRRLAVTTSRPTPDLVRIQVSDNGVGIPSENLNRIFNQGFTTRKTGHGFGLHNAANTARAMGGSLTPQSPGPGQGATFTFDLPVHTATQTDSPAAKPGSDSERPKGQAN
jgi:signal transduction histidine kinase/ligand-binding sensor domain-containing protein